MELGTVSTGDREVSTSSARKGNKRINFARDLFPKPITSDRHYQPVNKIKMSIKKYKKGSAEWYGQKGGKKTKKLVEAGKKALALEERQSIPNDKDSAMKALADMADLKVEDGPSIEDGY